MPATWPLLLGPGGGLAPGGQVPGQVVGPLLGRQAPGGCWQRSLKFHGEKQMVLRMVREMLRPPITPGQGGKLRLGAVG